MNYPFPDFVPVPSYETMHTISVESLIIGICIVCVGLVWLFLRKQNNKKTTLPWVCIGIGIVLFANHGIQLLFYLQGGF